MNENNQGQQNNYGQQPQAPQTPPQAPQPAPAPQTPPPYQQPAQYQPPQESTVSKVIREGSQATAAVGVVAMLVSSIKRLFGK